jgi:hypothetical protein
MGIVSPVIGNVKSQHADSIHEKAYYLAQALHP